MSGNVVVKSDARVLMAMAVVLAAAPALNALDNGAFLWSSSARAVETALAMMTSFVMLATPALLAIRRQLTINMYVLWMTVVMTGSLATRTAQNYDLGRSVNPLDWISMFGLATVVLILFSRLRKGR